MANTTDKSESLALAEGRYLKLQYEGDPAKLTLIAFRFNSSPSWPEKYFAKGDEDYPLDWPSVEVALSLCFLSYVELSARKKRNVFLFGKHKDDAASAKTLSNAIFQSAHKIHELFYGENPKSKSGEPDVTHLIFPRIRGINKSGRGKSVPPTIAISKSFLPPECIQVIWDVIAQDKGTDTLATTHVSQLLSSIRNNVKTYKRKVRQEFNSCNSNAASNNLIKVDLSDFSPERKPIYFRVTELRGFLHLTHKVYLEIADYVEPYHYGDTWILQNKSRGGLLKTRRMMENLDFGKPVSDPRSLDEAGVFAGDELRAFPLP